MKLGDDYTLLVVSAGLALQDLRRRRQGREERTASSRRSPAATSLDEIVFTLIEQDQNVKFDRVPFESGSEVIAASSATRSRSISVNPSEVLGQLESGDPHAAVRAVGQALRVRGPGRHPDGNRARHRRRRSPSSAASSRPATSRDEAKQYWIDAAKEFEQTDAYAEYIEENLMQANAVYGDDFIAYLEQNSADLERSWASESSLRVSRGSSVARS